jgi:hypothetical protein
VVIDLVANCCRLRDRGRERPSPEKGADVFLGVNADVGPKLARACQPAPFSATASSKPSISIAH